LLRTKGIGPEVVAAPAIVVGIEDDVDGIVFEQTIIAPHVGGQHASWIRVMVANGEVEVSVVE
jgi:hypothetical protein